MKTPNWLVLDIDGVLIDVSNSYDRAVELTVRHFLDAQGSEVNFSEKTVRELRETGRFGDDYKLTEVLVHAGLSKNHRQFIEKFPRGAGVGWARKEADSKVNKTEIVEVFDEFYLGPEPVPSPRGLWAREEPLVDTSLLNKISERHKLGFVTGRSREELELASQILEYELKNAVTSDEYLKPDPRALSSLVGRERGVYVGDTHNDEQLVRNHNDEGGSFTFIMVTEETGINDILQRIIRNSN